MPQKILLIDDSLLAPRLNETLLPRQLADCDILLAPRGADAFERFHLAEPDLILINDSLPDMDGEAICHRLLSDPLTAAVPVIVLAGNGHSKPLLGKYSNVVRQMGAPIDPEALRSAVGEALSVAKPRPHPSAGILSRDPARIVFSGHTPFFPLRSAIHMACGDQLDGVLRVFINKVPVELFFAKGRFLFATTRNAALYTKDSPVILSSTNLGLIAESLVSQSVSGWPLFLFLASRSGFPHDDVVQITRDHGQRLFSSVFTAGRVNFEFEETAAFPEFARNFPPATDDPDNWLLHSLRYVKFDTLTARQRPDPNGNPNYTQRGYESIQRLGLNDVEARFAASINGSSSLQQIAKKMAYRSTMRCSSSFGSRCWRLSTTGSAQLLSLPVAQ